MTQLDFVLHLNVADDEPGSPATLATMYDWLIPDLLHAIGSLLGHPGDYGATWAGDPRYQNYEAILVECFHDRCDGPNEDGLYQCLVCGLYVTTDGMPA